MFISTKQKFKCAIVALLLLVAFAIVGLASCSSTIDKIIIPQEEDFSGMSWVDAYKAFHAKMSREYAFSEWRNVDWDALNEKYLPQIESAESKNDAGAYLAALRGYVFSIPDGHIMIKGGDSIGMIKEKVGGGFGLCLTGLDDGSIIADLVIAGGPADLAGIEQGAVITKWNGLPIMEALAQVDLLWRLSYQPIANDEHGRVEQYRYLVRAPVGTEATIVFRNEGAAGQEATLTAIDDNYATLNQANFAAGADTSVTTFYEILASGYGYVKVNYEASDQGALDGFKQAIRAFVDANVPGVIVDLRGNHGGDDQMAANYAGFFYEARSFYEYQNFYNSITGQFSIGIQGETEYVPAGGSLYIEPQTPHYSGPVVALVNPATISSGEGVAMGIARAPRGEVMGFYGTNGLFGMVGNGAKMPEGIEIKFPYGQSLNEDKIIQLDSRNGVGGVAPTVRVPLTKDSAIAFANGDDPELEFAIAWMIANP